MGKIPYIPLYIGDWEQDMNSISLQTEAAWLKVIFKMFKDNKSGIYKTSTKALQNLWKCTTNDVQNILFELIENNICDIEIGENIVFTNRRMIKEAEISKIRTKAVQNRYKTSTKEHTKPLQNTEYEIENETVNENNIGGVGENFLKPADEEKNHVLPKHEIDNCKIVISSRTNPRHFATDEEILTKWNEFKAIKFNGQNTFYGWNKVYESFKNWLGYQISNNKFFTNATHRTDNKKRTGADFFIDKIRESELNKFPT